jgi:hypothetical protein
MGNGEEIKKMKGRGGKVEKDRGFQETLCGGEWAREGKREIIENSGVL